MLGACLNAMAALMFPREFRLATLMPFTYTHFFHVIGWASVAQGQSTGFVNQMLWVQVPPLASLAGTNASTSRRRGTPRTT